MDNEKKYKSLFSPDKEIRADQYIIELLCKNKATRLKQNLSIGFSTQPVWAQYFKSQLRKCQYYLDKYHPDVIISAIKNKSLYSLYPDWIDDVLQNEHNRILNITESITDIDHKRIYKSTGKQKKDLDLEKFN